MKLIATNKQHGKRCSEIQQWLVGSKKKFPYFDFETINDPLIFYQIEHPGIFLNAELNQLSKSVIEFKIW